MTETQSSQDVSTKLERIAKLAKDKPGVSLLTLAHHIDGGWLREAYRRTRKDGARGVDGQSAEQYAAQLEANLQSLLDRAKSGSYRAPPVRRVHIPKGDGTETRPIGVPTFEDKVLQRAVAMVIGEVYEQEFYDFSYGFRPGRSAHQAVEAVQKAAWRMRGGWLVEVDIKKFLETSSQCTPCVDVDVEEARMRFRDANAQAVSSTGADMDRVELAALYTLQHGLA